MKSNELTVTPVPLSLFTWHKEKKSLSAEISKLNFNVCVSNWFCVPLYNDSADIGIAICSETTRKTHRFYLVEKHTDEDRDTTHWEFRPIEKDCPIQLVTIWND